MAHVQATLQLGWPGALVSFCVLEGRGRERKSRDEGLAREKAMGDRIDRRQCEMTEMLEGVVRDNTQVVREATGIMGQLRDRLRA